MSEITNTVTDSRTIEKLTALLRYEMDPKTGGCSASETFDALRTHLLETANRHWPHTEEPTDEEVARHDAAMITISEHILQGIIAAGWFTDAEEFVEGLAWQRRTCQAKFGQPRAIPFTPEERATLAAEWGSSSGLAS
jgi:hypothetical protein